MSTVTIIWFAVGLVCLSALASVFRAVLDGRRRVHEARAAARAKVEAARIQAIDFEAERARALGDMRRQIEALRRTGKDRT